MQGRITAVILLTSVAVLFVGCSMFMAEQHRATRASEARMDRRLVLGLAQFEADALGRRDQTDLRENLINLRKLGGEAIFAEVVDADGRRLAGFDDRRPGAAGRTQTYTQPLVRQGRALGRLVLTTPERRDSLAVSELLATGGALFFAATALALFLGRWLASRVSAPVARLTRTMESVGESGEFTVRVEPGVPDEIGRLTLSFNNLMARLQSKDEALRNTMGELVDARDAAEAANVAKSQFLANMSHEIRTPLNGVLAMAQIMALSDLAPVQREQVDVIRQSGEALLTLLNDILDVSKIEAGKLELEVADFDAETAVRDAHSAFAPVADRKGLAFELHMDAAVAGLRRGDAGRLRQILNNFLSNALKFTSQGEVGLCVYGEGADGADGLRILVEDSGIGIPDDKRSILFEKFTQVDASTTRRFGGTGLGLAICRELATLMGGRIWVDSREGGGSVFGVSLPLARIGPAAVKPTPRPMSDEVAESEGAMLRVLAAEDNPTNQLVLRTIMQIFGVHLVMVGDGLAAVEAWRREPFDVILMDIQMPRMDGVAATRMIRVTEAQEGRPRIPIIALSANALTHQVQAYAEAGMDGHVAKPIELEKLQAALEGVLSAPTAGSRRLRSNIPRKALASPPDNRARA